MASLNKVILIGRLANDPELRYTAGGLAVASFTVAVDRPFKNQETGEKKTDFFRCKAWRQKAEFVNQYVQKGRLVAIEGRIELNDYVGQDGQKRYSTDVVVDQVETLDSQRDRAGEAAPAGGAPAGNYGGQRQQPQQNYAADADSGNGYHEEEAPAPAPRQAAPRQAAPARQAPQAQAAPARPAARQAPAQPAYPADDDFDDSDPFADE